MADAALTAKQALRRIVAEAFPWLPSIVVQASAKGKGLCIRAASGLLHLAGGPDDPAVVRVTDTGSAGTWSATGNVITFTGIDSSVMTWTFALAGGAITITQVPPAPPYEQKTIALTGSNKVTCA